MTRPRNLRSEMPTVAAWVDELRDAFGAETIDGQIRKAVKDGLPTFWARENGHEIGARPAPMEGLTVDRLVLYSVGRQKAKP